VPQEGGAGGFGCIAGQPEPARAYFLGFGFEVCPYSDNALIPTGLP